MYVTLGRAEPAPRITTETPGPVSPMALRRVLDTTTSEFRAVCRVYARTKRGHAVGSGVLITPRHVLTCAHVISPPEEPNDVRWIEVFVAQNGPADKRTGIRADAWAVKLGWTANCCRSWDEDYGIIRLSKPATGYWPISPFDPGRLVGKTGYVAGYPTRTGDPDAHVMFESRGAIDGTFHLDSCMGTRFEGRLRTAIDDMTRLVAHRLDTAKSMSGGPMWSFVDGRRTLWGLHAGDIDHGRKKAVLLSKSVRGQIGRWVTRELPAR